MSYLEPNSPIKYKEDHIYPLTTLNQIIMPDGNRLSGVGVFLYKPEEAEEATIAGTNADTLGGVLASEYVTFESIRSASISYDQVIMPDGTHWNGAISSSIPNASGVSF